MNERLRQYIRKQIKKILKEISTSAGAGSYLTPMAFTGGKTSANKKKRKIAQQVGMIITPKGEEHLGYADTLYKEGKIK